MVSQFGVIVQRTSSAARPINLFSSTVIGIVGTAKDAKEGIYYFGQLKEAKEKLKEGSIGPALYDIDLQNISTPIIISISTDDSDANIIKALELLKESYGRFGYKPDLIIAPGFSHSEVVAQKIDSISESLRSFGIVDAYAESETAAINFAKKFASERMIICDPYVNISLENSRPLSTFIAALMAKTDSLWEYGFADSFSNRVIQGVIGTSRPIQFIPGEVCEADRLRGGGITTVIPYKGFRSWGGETRSPDSIWKSMTRVRVFDKIMTAALDSLFWAIDRRADALKIVKDSVEQLMLNLKGANVLLGFNVFFDPELNTKTNITDGKFYLTVEMQEMPIVKTFQINFSYVDRYSDLLIKEISS